MELKNRREFIKLAGTALLVTSGISVFGLVSAQAHGEEGAEDQGGYYRDGYWLDGYYQDGYYYDGYSTGVSEIPHESIKLVIAPNPSNGNFELGFDAKEYGHCEITIYDLAGRALVQKDYQLQQGANRIAFQSGTLSRGVYELQVKTETASGNLRLMILE